MVRGELVGRQRELALLDRRMRTALDGDTQVVLVAGEPGVGKSRLAEETARRASERGMACGWGRATPQEGSPPYWVFRQAVRDLASHTSAVEEPGVLVPVLDGTRSDPARAAERFRLFEAVTDFLARLAEPSGLLVVLDDLQWADRSSLQLLVHLAMTAHRTRLLVLGSYRDTEVGDHLQEALADLAGEPVVTRLRVTGLTEPEVAAQLAGVTGRAVPRSVAGAVWRRTRGNPFFVGELGSLLVESPEFGHEELPVAVRDAVRGRLARLSAPCRAVVSAAAVLGSELDAAGIAAATGRELSQVLAAVDEASAAGVLSEGRFAHDLVREVARDEVSTLERHAVHRRMAEHLSGFADAQDRVAQIAFHSLESLPAGDASAAVSWAERAAEQAMAQLAWEDAEDLLGRALAAATNPQVSGADRCQLLLGRARAQVRVFDVAGARRSLLEAATIARAAGDAGTTAEAALTMEGITDPRWDATGWALCEEALAGLPDEDSPLRARVLAHSVVTGVVTQRTDAEAELRSAAALAMAERVGDPRAVVAALRARQLARSGPDGAADRLALGDRMLEVGQDGDSTGIDDETLLWGRLWRFDALVQLGDLDRAEAELSLIAELADRLRSALARWHVLRSRAAVAQGRGRFADAEALGVEAAAIARRAGHPGTQELAWGFLLVLAIQTGNEELFPEGIPDVEVWPTAVVRWHLAQDRRPLAHRAFRTLQMPESLQRYGLLTELASRAELAAEFDDRETASDVYPRLAPFADLFVSGGAGTVAVLGSVRLPLGQAAAALGRLDEAVRHLRAAVEANERAGLPPFTAASRYWLARILTRRHRPGDRSEADALAALAAASAETLGMAPLRRDAHRLATRLEDRPSGPLTRREQEIAVLVSHGLTNRQIAATAHISERTAESHVQHILDKLGFNNRVQIAAWMTAAGTPTDGQ